MDVRPYAVVPFQKGTPTYRVKRYRQRAELLREIARDLVARECHDTLVRLANTYDAMAAQESALPQRISPASKWAMENVKEL